jgi:uncharacterized protein (TIRG00374 family)
MPSDANREEISGVPAHVWHRWVGRGVFFLAAIMCLYLGATVWTARGNLVQAMQQLPMGTLPSVLALVLLGLALRAGRWHYYVRYLRWDVPWHHSLIAFLASFAFTATPGKAGEVVKSVLLRTRYDVPLADGMGVLLVERLGDLLAVLVLAVGGLALLADSLIYFLAAALLVVGMTVFTSSRRIYAPILSRMAKISKLADLVNKILHLLNAGEALLRPTPFLVGVGIAVIAWGCEGWAFHLLIRGFGVESGFFTSCSIYGIATLVGALSALPGGLGSFEVVMALLLSRLGMPLATTTLPIVLFRLCTLWLGSFVGLIAMVGWFSYIAPAGVQQSSGDAS